ncbi:MAG: sensor histidine kinase [Planctomycetota bacterium]|jgi:signal transduction histidine kinase
MKSHTTSNAAFFLVTAFCMVLMAWWVFFMVREAGRLEELGRLIPADRLAEAAKILGVPADSDIAAEAERRRWMFTSESIVLGVLVMLGVFLLYRGMVRERRMRELQERFLTGATHHLKTPLATLRLGIESMLAGTMPEEKRQHYLEAMVREVDHLEQDLTNLLTAGGLTDSRQGLRLVQGDLADDIRDAIDSMQDRCRSAGVTVTSESTEPMPVQRDREAVHHILHNLLDNAVKYGKRDGKITVALTRNGAMARLSIADDGSGIEAKDLPHVFERFYRGQHKQHRGGTGVGLYIVQEVVKSHGGTVTVHSEGAGKGTRFDISLPLATEVS